MLILKVIFFLNIILNKKYFKKHEIYSITSQRINKTINIRPLG